MNPHERKATETRLKKAEADMDVAKAEQRIAQHRIAELQRTINGIKASLQEQNTIRVSEHALLRWAERVNGFDLAATETAILSAIEDRAFALGNGKYPVLDGVVAVVKDRTVVTIETR